MQNQSGLEESRTAAASDLVVPQIDIRAFSESADEVSMQKAKEALAEACSTHGFFYVTGHRFTRSQRELVFGASKEFFDLSLEHKNKIPIKSGGFTRGYVPVGGESGSKLFELKEAFSYGYKWSGAPTNPLQGPNEWPEASLMSPGWRTTMEEFYTTMMELSEVVTGAVSLSLGHNAEYLGNYCKKGDTISLCRFFNYLPQSSPLCPPEAGPMTGSSPHTDWGFLTLIAQDSTGGLQVHHDGKWQEIQPCEDGLLVNCGDYLSLLTGGKYISPLHRVMLHPTKHR